VTQNVRLVVKYGHLYFPTGDWQDPAQPSLLIRIYPAGDCDTCPWPMVNHGSYSVEKQRMILACALFDERESNGTFPNHATIELPDGEVFDFDPLVP